MILDAATKTKVLEIIRKSDRIITIKLVLKTSITIVISMYVPRVKRTEVEKKDESIQKLT